MGSVVSEQAPCLRHEATQTGSTLISHNGLLKDMAKPNVRITLEGGIIDVGVLAPGVQVEVRDYDIQGIDNTKQLWTDGEGKRCLRYFVPGESGSDEADRVIADLERFADDLQTHAGVSTTLTPDSSPDGLHVLAINNTDFYFEAGSGRYDGWGKAVGPGGEARS